MFEKVTGFFRRFRSKRKTSETAMLSPDEGFDDFGLDDADFGDTIGTDEFSGGESLGGASLAADDELPGDAALSNELDSLSGVETFETLGDEGFTGGTLGGGSGESLLEDSQPAAGTFDDDLGGFDSDEASGGGGGSLDDDFEDFGGGFGDLDAGGAADLGVPAGPAEPARVRLPILLGVVVLGLAAGAGAGIMVPKLMGGGGGIPLEQELQKVESDERKAKRSLSIYNKLGGLAAIEQLKADLAAATEQYATLEDLDAAVEEAQAREEAYDAVVLAAQEAERERAEHVVAREALTQQIADAHAQLAAQRRAVAAALAEYQRRRHAMEASAVVAAAFDEADDRYTHERVREMGARPIGVPTGE